MFLAVSVSNLSAHDNPKKDKKENTEKPKKQTREEKRAVKEAQKKAAAKNEHRVNKIQGK